jgi:TolA-binding protein
MKQTAPLILLILITSAVMAGPILQMNKAFNALNGMIPFLVDEKKFEDKKNEKIISQKMEDLQAAFKTAKHETLLKQDLFAPSYAVINEHIAESTKAFKKGNKDYAHWRMRELTSLCLDCHTRLPVSHPSSFQSGELSIDPSAFDNKYNLGIAQLIVRRYPDAKQSFTAFIDEKIVQNNFQDITLPFKQLLLIDLKVLKNSEDMKTLTAHYMTKKQLPENVKSSLKSWNQRLKYWEKKSEFVAGIKDEKHLDRFFKEVVEPLHKVASYDDQYDVDFLLISGLLSHYLFENPESPKAAELNYRLGWAEKFLKREQFFGSGDSFLKQCIRRYPDNPVAQKCLDEYKESVNFEFSGSSGTSIPLEVQEEIEDLQNLIKKR